MSDLKDRDELVNQPEPTDDTEGHGLLVDPYSARKLENSRVADLEREARDRLLRKETRPNR